MLLCSLPAWAAVKHDIWFKAYVTKCSFKNNLIDGANQPTLFSLQHFKWAVLFCSLQSAPCFHGLKHIPNLLASFNASDCPFSFPTSHHAGTQ